MENAREINRFSLAGASNELYIDCLDYVRDIPMEIGQNYLPLPVICLLEEDISLRIPLYEVDCYISAYYTADLVCLFCRTEVL